MVLLQDVFVFDHRMGTDENGRPLGHIKATGLRPHITQRLADRGVKVDPSIFDTDLVARASVGHAGPAAQPVQPAYIQRR